MGTDEAKLVFQKHEEMLRLLSQYCDNVFHQWTSRVDRDCQFNLEQPLLLRNPRTSTLSVNFNKQVWSSAPPTLQLCTSPGTHRGFIR